MRSVNRSTRTCGRHMMNMNVNMDGDIMKNVTRCPDSSANSVLSIFAFHFLFYLFLLLSIWLIYYDSYLVKMTHESFKLLTNYELPLRHWHRCRTRPNPTSARPDSTSTHSARPTYKYSSFSATNSLSSVHRCPSVRPNPNWWCYRPLKPNSSLSK